MHQICIGNKTRHTFQIKFADCATVTNCGSKANCSVVRHDIHDAVHDMLKSFSAQAIYEDLYQLGWENRVPYL